IVGVGAADVDDVVLDLSLTSHGLVVVSVVDYIEQSSRDHLGKINRHSFYGTRITSIIVSEGSVGTPRRRANDGNPSRQASRRLCEQFEQGHRGQTGPGEKVRAGIDQQS